MDKQLIIEMVDEIKKLIIMENQLQEHKKQLEQHLNKVNNDIKQVKEMVVEIDASVRLALMLKSVVTIELE